MGGKRGNENAQMSKEDYDAMQTREEARGGNEGNGVVTQGFQRASAETLRGKKSMTTQTYKQAIIQRSQLAVYPSNIYFV